MTVETASLGRQRRVPRQGKVRGSVPLSVPFQVGPRSTSPRSSERASERWPRGPGRPFCACATHLAPPPARRTPLPPNLNASSSGRAGLPRPTDPAGLPNHSSGRRAARAAGLQPRDAAFSLKSSTSKDRAAVRARTGVLCGPLYPEAARQTVTPLSPPLCTL